MNETLQNAVAEILERTINGIDSSVAFMQAELPDVISQLLMWYGVKSAVLTIAGVLILIGMLAADRAAFRHLLENYDTDELLLLWGLMGSIARFLYLVPIYMINLEWLQIWIAPKIWLMEYAASIVK